MKTKRPGDPYWLPEGKATAAVMAAPAREGITAYEATP
jgi:hypothetical protein